MLQRVAAGFVLAALSCGVVWSQTQTESTREMAEALARLSRAADARLNLFLNDRRVELIQRQTEPVDYAEKVEYLSLLAREQLLAGLSGAAVQTYERLYGVLLEQPEGHASSRATRRVRRDLALSYLRLGEQDNCVLRHNIERCLLPIRGEGVHGDRRGSSAAKRIYAELLDERPRDLESRWLYNIASMTLGRSASDAPDDWLIPEAAFASEHDVGRFFDVAPQLGVDVFGLSGGSVTDDFDGDGDLDLLASGYGLEEQLRFFLNNGDGTFSEKTREAGLLGLVGGLNLVQADYDNDGRLDVLVLRGAWLGEQGLHPNSLLRNEGVTADGAPRFSDVTEAAGLLSFHPTQTAAWADYDADGWLDLYVGNESGEQDHPAELFRNNGAGANGVVTFTDVAARVGVDVSAFVKGVAWGDYDNDGLPDLYVSVLSQPGPNLLFRNLGPQRNGEWSFEEVAGAARVGRPLASFPTWFFDYDNDGWLDLFVAGYRASVADVAAEYLGRAHTDAEKTRLYRNAGDGTFIDVTRQAGLDRPLLTMGCNFGDLDNDGYLDFYLGTGDTDFSTLIPNRMFRNDGRGGFQDVTTAGGFGHLQKGHGVSFADLDHDGDQDLYAVMGGAFSGDGFNNVLFENPGHGNRWIGLDLEGVTANRSAIGARVELVVDTPQGKRSIHRTVSSGGSFGASSLRLEVGLGDAQRIVSIAIRWPLRAGETQSLEGLELDRFYVVRQGEAPRVLDLSSMKFVGDPGAASHSHHADARE